MDFSQFIKNSPEERAAIYNQIVDTTDGGTSRITGVGGDLTPLTPEQQAANNKAIEAVNSKPVNSFANHIQGRITPTKDNWWWVGLPNTAYNLGDIGTGIAYGFTHIPELSKQFIDYEKQNHQNVIREAKMAKQMLKDGTMTPSQYIDYIGRAMYASPLVATTRDALNAIGTPYALKTTTPVEFINATKKGGINGLGKQIVRQGKETAKSMLESPADVFLDLMGTGLVSKGVKGIPRIGEKIKAGEQAENILNAKNAKIQQDINKVTEQLNQAKAVSQEAGLDMSGLIKRAEETGDWEGVPVTVREKLKNFSENYNEIAKRYSPQTAVDSEHLTIAQNIARKRDITYRDAEKSLKALYDSIPEGVERSKGLEDLAKTGDKLAQDVMVAKQAYKEGRLFPITHAMKENWILDDLEKSGRGLDDLDRVYSGKFSTREYGLHSYEDIAKSLAKPDEFLEALSKQYLGDSIKQELLNGTLNGKTVAATKEADNVYIPRQVLEESGSIEKVTNKATKVPTSATDIPIDKKVLEELRTQTKSVGNFFANNVANDMIKLGKGSMLAGMTYLGANAIGGGINSLLASGLHTLDDFANAIKTQGQLAKELGAYRKTRTIKPLKTKALDWVQQVNKYTTGAVTDLVDRKIQNLYTEMGAHRNLREKGIQTGDRLKAIDNMEAQQLGDIIRDIKSEALLESNRTTLPRWAIEAGSAINPFWRWNDTALRSTIHMTRKYPFASNLILNQTLARIGFDKEIQDRLNLGVKSDKRGVSYFFDDKTGQIKEASIEWIPQQNTFKIISDPSSYFKDNPLSSPTLVRLYNVTQGKDQYGKPLKRADKSGYRHLPDNLRGVRWVATPYGMVEQGSKLDEVAATFAKEQIGVFNALNKTAVPAVGTMLGLNYYQPYAQSLFGDFTKTEEDNNFITGGDPRKPRELGDVVGSFLGLYSRPYVPRLQEERPLSLSQGRSLMRANRYDMLKKQRGY